MIQLRPLSPILLGVFVLGGCAAQDRSVPLPSGPDKPTVEELNGHQIRQIAFWKGHIGDHKALALEDRYSPCPPEMVEYIAIDNELNDFSGTPRAAALDQEFESDVRSALASIPKAVKSLLTPGVVTVCVVADLGGGTGLSESVHAADGRPVAGLVVLDATALDRRANEWATFKDNSFFRRDSAHRLESLIATPTHDNRRGAIRYIVLHEFGHLVGLFHDMHPSWTETDVPIAGHEFAEISWIDRDGKWSSRWEEALPFRVKVRPYKFEEAALATSEIIQVFDGLAKTDFPTLYAANSNAEDFAESFATYVHSVLDGRPWKITVKEGDTTIREVELCWDEPRCEKKRAALDDLFDGD